MVVTVMFYMTEKSEEINDGRQKKQRNTVGAGTLDVEKGYGHIASEIS
jgi:hypothetical protein